MSACHADDSDSNSDLGVALFPNPSLRSGFGDELGFETCCNFLIMFFTSFWISHRLSVDEKWYGGKYRELCSLSIIAGVPQGDH